VILSEEYLGGQKNIYPENPSFKIPKALQILVEIQVFAQYAMLVSDIWKSRVSKNSYETVEEMVWNVERIAIDFVKIDF
jgi:hypothetical protein